MQDQRHTTTPSLNSGTQKDLLSSLTTQSNTKEPYDSHKEGQCKEGQCSILIGIFSPNNKRSYTTLTSPLIDLIGQHL